MIKTNDYNVELYYLGKVCKYNHVFLETNGSLRQKSNRTCLECQKNTTEKYKLTNREVCNERTKRWRKHIALKAGKETPTKKQCNTCKEWKNKKDFYPAKYSADGLIGHCKSCDKLRQVTYRAKRRKPIIRKDPELIKENRRKIKRRYKKSVKGKLANTKAHHRRKVILLKAKSERYTPTQILERFSEFKNKCAYCGRKEKLTIDHFIPITKRGADRLENIVPACIRCNCSKYNNSPNKWYKKQIFYSEERWKIIRAKISI